jgi:hypothetical protein
MTVAITGWLYGYGNLSGSASFALTTFPRATTPTVSASSVALGSAVTIGTPRHSSSFTHTLSIHVDGAYYSTIATGVATSYAWTVPADFASIMPSGTSKTIEVVCSTYSGSTLIGYGSVNLTLTVPATDAYMPTITSHSEAEATTSPDVAAQFGAYVQGESTLALSMAAAGVYGSTIRSYSMAANGQTVADSSGTTNALTASGSQSVTFSATDTRGRTRTVTDTIDVLAYSLPQVSEVHASRCTSDGTDDDQGTYCKVVFSATITALDSKNTKSFVIRYRQRGADTWTEVDVTSAVGGYVASGYTRIISGFSTDHGFEVGVVATDFFGSSSGQDSLSTAYTRMSWSNTVRGVAFGKVNELPGFENAMPEYRNDGAGAMRRVQRYIAVDATLTASGWDPTAKTQTVTDAAITATNDVAIVCAGELTADQKAAWAAIGVPLGSGVPASAVSQAAGSLTFTAQTVPTADIPIRLLCGEDAD